MGFIDWLQENGGTLVEIALWAIGIASAITGFFSTEKAEGIRAVLLRIAHFIGGLAPKDQPGTLSIPFTNIDIKPKPE